MPLRRLLLVALCIVLAGAWVSVTHAQMFCTPVTWAPGHYKTCFASGYCGWYYWCVDVFCYVDGYEASKGCVPGYWQACNSMGCWTAWIFGCNGCG